MGGSSARGVRASAGVGGGAAAGQDYAVGEGSCRLRRAGIVLALVQGRSGGQIAEMFAASPWYVGEVLRAFKDTGSRHWTQNGAAAGHLSSVRPRAS